MQVTPRCINCKTPVFHTYFQEDNLLTSYRAQIQIYSHLDSIHLPVAVLQLAAATPGLVSGLVRGLLVAPAAEAELEAERKSGVHSGAGSSPESGAELEIPLSVAAAVKSAEQLEEMSWGHSQVAASLVAAAAAYADLLRSAQEGLWKGRTAVGSVSAQSAAPFEEWEAFHLQSKRKHKPD